MAESLDELLDGSAPAIADRGSARDTALAQMVRDAHVEVRPSKRRGRRIALLSGGLAVLLAGGAGIAVASGVPLPWSQAEQDPFVAVKFTLPSGLKCEERFGVANEAQLKDTGMGDWLRTYVAEHDILKISDVDGRFALIKSSSKDQWQGTPPSEDEQYIMAVNGAVSWTIFEQATKAGFDPSELGSHTYCTDDQGNLVEPR